MFRRLGPVLTSFILVLTYARLRASGDTQIRTAVSESTTIFVAEIEAAQPDDGCARLWRGLMSSRCNTKVHARILRVYKSVGDTTNAPVEFDCEIHQQIAMSGTVPWQTHEKPIQPGQRFLILSQAQRDLPLIFATTPGSFQVTDKEDIVGDLELMLGSESLTIAQQASTIASAIANSASSRSFLLAQYAGRLLAAGPDAETASLAEAIESSHDHAFSVRGQSELLHTLAYESKSGTKGPDNLTHVFVTMTARYFLLPPNEPTLLVPDLHEVILSSHIPAILKSDRATAMLRRALGPELRERFARRVREAAADEKLPQERKAQLRQLLALLGAQ